MRRKYSKADMARDAALIIYAHRVSGGKDKVTASRIILERDLTLSQSARLLAEIKRQTK